MLGAIRGLYGTKAGDPCRGLTKNQTNVFIKVKVRTLGAILLRHGRLTSLWQDSSASQSRFAFIGRAETWPKPNSGLTASVIPRFGADDLHPLLQFECMNSRTRPRSMTCVVGLSTARLQMGRKPGPTSAEQSQS
jgi:hypothetical protein